jgi:2-polyprenyl-3-methyl-5-hydroxy-6-metoxy-1,4-benzoquinol methylase
MDKAGQKYWNNAWARSNLPEMVNPSDMRLTNYTNRRFHKLFLQLFDKSNSPSMHLLEIGCAKSSWLPYFANEFGFSVSGIDYSPAGCEMAIQVLRANEVEGDVVCADFFSPPDTMFGTFDVIVSFGVVEHFEDTALCLRAFSLFLKPGGVLITNIPNMVGSIGYIQKIVNKPVYDIHKLIDTLSLAKAHECAGLEVLQCDYFMATGFGVNNLADVPEGSLSWFLKKVFLGVLSRLSMLVWLMEEVMGEFSTRKMFSPYINCVARKV